jgi:hypothetical protein
MNQFMNSWIHQQINESINQRPRNSSMSAGISWSITEKILEESQSSNLKYMNKSIREWIIPSGNGGSPYSIATRDDSVITQLSNQWANLERGDEVNEEN